MGRRLLNTGWCWDPRCEFCISCTGGPLLIAQLSGVANADCPACLNWSAAPINMAQVQPCLWQGEIVYCNGRIEFGLGPDPLGGPFVLLEASVYEIAVNGPQVGNEVFIGDWRSLSGTTKVNCNFDNTLLGAFTPSAYIIGLPPNGWQQCNWALSNIRISKAPCEEEST